MDNIQPVIKDVVVSGIICYPAQAPTGEVLKASDRCTVWSPFSEPDLMSCYSV